MFKPLATTLCLALTAVLYTSCGSDSNNATVPTTDAPQAPNPLVPMAYTTMDFNSDGETVYTFTTNGYVTFGKAAGSNDGSYTYTPVVHKVGEPGTATLVIRSRFITNDPDNEATEPEVRTYELTFTKEDKAARVWTAQGTMTSNLKPGETVSYPNITITQEASYK